MSGFCSYIDFSSDELRVRENKVLFLFRLSEQIQVEASKYLLEPRELQDKR